MTISKTTRKDFIEATKLKNIWNRIIEWNGLKLATVMWHDNPWKIVDNKMVARNDKDFNIIADRAYQPIATFRTQDDMWKYLKSIMI